MDVYRAGAIFRIASDNFLKEIVYNTEWPAIAPTTVAEFLVELEKKGLVKRLSLADDTYIVRAKK